MFDVLQKYSHFVHLNIILLLKQYYSMNSDYILLFYLRTFLRHSL